MECVCWWARVSKEAARGRDLCSKRLLAKCMPCSLLKSYYRYGRTESAACCVNVCSHSVYHNRLRTITQLIRALTVFVHCHFNCRHFLRLHLSIDDLEYGNMKHPYVGFEIVAYFLALLGLQMGVRIGPEFGNISICFHYHNHNHNHLMINASPNNFYQHNCTMIARFLRYAGAHFFFHFTLLCFALLLHLLRCAMRRHRMFGPLCLQHCHFIWCAYSLIRE